MSDLDISTDAPPDLDPQDLALLHTHRDAESPAAVRVDRVWTDIEASVGEDALHPPTRRRAVAGWVLGLAAAAAVVLAVGLGLAWTAREGAQQAGDGAMAPRLATAERTRGRVVRPASGVQARPVSPPQTGSGDLEEAVPPELDRPQPAAPVTTPNRSAPRRPHPAGDGPKVSPTVQRSTPPPAVADPSPPVQRPGAKRVAGETALLQGARAALTHRDYDRALGILQDHATRYPGGLLVEEREALRAMARCERGDAGNHAQGFTRRFPRSPLRERVAKSCRK